MKNLSNLPRSTHAATTFGQLVSIAAVGVDNGYMVRNYGNGHIFNMTTLKILLI
jgi:hypothetical protein